MTIRRRAAKKRDKTRDKSKDYFGKKTELAILKFLNASSNEEKNIIFENEINRTFNVLVSNLIFVYKIKGNLTNVKHDCVRHLYNQLEKFNPERKSKAFSFFSVVAKHWLMAYGMLNEKNDKRFVNIDNEQTKIIIVTRSKNEYFENKNDEKIFFIEFVLKTLKDEISNCKKESDKIVINAIIYLLENTDNIDIFNKKAIMIYLRDMTSLDKKVLINSLNRIKIIYKNMRKEWLQNEGKI